MGGALGASMYWGYHEQKRLLQTQVITYFCFWSTAWFQKTASLSTEHPVSNSSHANTNVRTRKLQRVNNFRSTSFTECCPFGEAISLHRQVFQTVSVASSDSNHTNPLLWLLLASQIPRTERCSSRSYLRYLCSYVLLPKLCRYWFPHYCWVWFSAPFDLTLLFCSLSCLSFCPQFCVGWISKNASCDIETKRVVTSDIQCRPWKCKPPHLHIAFERMKKEFTILTYALSPQISINALLILMGWAAPLHTSIASPLQMLAWSWMNNGSFGSVAELKSEEKQEGNNSADKIKSFLTIT